MLQQTEHVTAVRNDPSAPYLQTLPTQLISYAIRRRKTTLEKGYQGGKQL